MSELVFELSQKVQESSHESQLPEYKKSQPRKQRRKMTDYFKNLEDKVKYIFPERILNYDETNLTDDPGSTNCTFRRRLNIRRGLSILETHLFLLHFRPRQ